MPFAFAQNNSANQHLFPIKPTISLSKPEKIKIMSIGMSPIPLKIGDQPQFTVTFKNVSDKPLYRSNMRCNSVPPLTWDISPSSNVQEQTSLGFSLLRCPGYFDLQPSTTQENWKTLEMTIKPNQTFIARGIGIHGGIFTVTRDGELHVTMKLDLADGTRSGLQSTIQFNVNATR